jgi:hypothetical protein
MSFPVPVAWLQVRARRPGAPIEAGCLAREVPDPDRKAKNSRRGVVGPARKVPVPCDCRFSSLAQSTRTPTARLPALRASRNVLRAGLRTPIAGRKDSGSEVHDLARDLETADRRIIRLAHEAPGLVVSRLRALRAIARPRSRSSGSRSRGTWLRPRGVSPCRDGAFCPARNDGTARTGQNTSRPEPLCPAIGIRSPDRRFRRPDSRFPGPRPRVRRDRSGVLNPDCGARGAAVRAMECGSAPTRPAVGPTRPRPRAATCWLPAGRGDANDARALAAGRRRPRSGGNDGARRESGRTRREPGPVARQTGSGRNGGLACAAATTGTGRPAQAEFTEGIGSA